MNNLMFLVGLMMTLILLSCKERNSPKETIISPEEVQGTKVESDFTIDNIQQYPLGPGCECRYLNINTRDTIYYDDNHAKFACLRINGKMETFKNAEFNRPEEGRMVKSWSNDKYAVTIDTKEIEQSSDEIWSSEGTLMIKNKNKKIKEIKIVGYCGC